MQFDYHHGTNQIHVGPFLGMLNTSSDESDDGIIDPTEVFTMDDYVGLQNNLNNIVRQIASNIQAIMGAPQPRC